MKNLILIILIIPLLSFSQITVSGQKATYSNPYPQPIKVQVESNPYNAWNQAVQNNNAAMSNMMGNLAASGAFKTARQKAEDLIPLNGKNINKYKYIVVASISASKEKEVSKIRKVISEDLSNTNFKLIQNLDNIPEDLISKPDLALYLYLVSENENWPFKNVVLSLTDIKGNVIHQRSVRHDRSAAFLTGLVLQKIKLYPHRFNINSSIKEENELTKNDEVITKENSFKELKNLKELLDLEIITQEEYDKKAEKLKSILIK